MTNRRDFIRKSLIGGVGVSLTGAASSAGLAGAETMSKMISGQLLDVAPFSLQTREESGRILSLRWGEPRKIRKVVIETPADGKILKPEKIKLQYWHKIWDGKADPVSGESGAGGVGWAEIDDWTHGVWKDADTKLNTGNDLLTFTFNSTGKNEFNGLGQSGVSYRKTLKLRLVSEQPLSDKIRVRTYTDAVCREMSIKIHLGKPAEAAIKPGSVDEGRLEIFNGSVVALKPAPGSNISVKENFRWELKNSISGVLEADLIVAVDPVDQRYDRTIVTLRSEYRPVSFLLDEVGNGQRVLIDDLGVMVVRGDDQISIEEYRELRKEFPGRTIYSRVEEHEEQTLMNAWNDMPIKHPIWFVHGLPGNRNAIKHNPDGSINISNSRRWFGLNKSAKDSMRKGWKTDMPGITFGFPSEYYFGGRELLDGYLPQVKSWWQEGPVYYEQVALMDKLDADLKGIKLDDPALLLMKIRVINLSASEKNKARLEFSSFDDAREKLVLDGNKVYSEAEGSRKFRFTARTEDKVNLIADDGKIVWSALLEPGSFHEIYLTIPTITLDKDSEITPLLSRSFQADSVRICSFWKEITDRGAAISTPEPWLNGFYRSQLTHMFINDLKDLSSERLYAHVGTMGYGVYANESIMMVTDLDRRGYHIEAENCLQTWLDFQGSVMLPGNFVDKDGLLYGVDGSEDGGYNKHHGYVLYGLGEHWWFTRDRAWMSRVADKVIKACDWVIRQRKVTMVKNPNGTKPVEYGFLPAGGLEDVQDYWFWLATNSATVWGFSNVAAALKDYGHPEADRLVREATAFRDDVMTGLNEAKILSPAVRLRDGTYVPKYPSRLYERGRSHGWIRETLEGSIFLIVQGLIPPDSPEARWIMKDYEDNLYISDVYGYSIPVFDRFWFSRGGFSMQSQLLDGPIPYIKDDKVKHFLRAYFNGLTAAFFPDVRMCNEHALPELGYPAGDHFKTSDEAQSTYWLRLMFVHEEGSELFIGQAVPRYWLASGKTGIDRAATYFGPLSVNYLPEINNKMITAIFDPPSRNKPSLIYVRFRHPAQARIRRVTVNGVEYGKFDPEKEWVILPGSVNGQQKIVAEY